MRTRHSLTCRRRSGAGGGKTDGRSRGPALPPPHGGREGAGAGSPPAEQVERGGWRRATRSAPNFAAPVTNKQIRPRKDLSHPIPACSAAAASLIGAEVIYLFDFSPPPSPCTHTHTHTRLPSSSSLLPSLPGLSLPARSRASSALLRAARPPPLRSRLRGAGAPRGGGRGAGAGAGECGAVAGPRARAGVRRRRPPPGRARSLGSAGEPGREGR